MLVLYTEKFSYPISYMYINPEWANFKFNFTHYPLKQTDLGGGGIYIGMKSCFSAVGKNSEGWKLPIVQYVSWIPITAVVLPSFQGKKSTKIDDLWNKVVDSVLCGSNRCYGSFDRCFVDNMKEISGTLNAYDVLKMEWKSFTLTR